MTPQISKRLSDALSQKDIALTRSILIGLLNNNFSQAEDAFNLSARELQSVVELHDGDFYPIIEDASSWTEDYWHGVTRDQMKNFSRERFEHLILVGSKLFPARVTSKTVATTKNGAFQDNTTSIDCSDSKNMRYEYVNDKLNPKDIKNKVRLDNAIREQDVVMARSIIIGLANSDFAEAGRAFLYAAERMPELLQQHDGELYPMSRDKFTWSEDYWHGITRDLMKNFSKERFEHLCEVGAHVLPKQTRHDSDCYNKDLSPPYQPDSSNKMVYIALAIGIVIVVPFIIWLMFF